MDVLLILYSTMLSAIQQIQSNTSNTVIPGSIVQHVCTRGLPSRRFESDTVTSQCTLYIARLGGLLQGAVFDSSDWIYRVGQIKRGHCAFLLVTNECIYQNL